MREPAAPLLIPGRPYAPDTLRKSNQQLAREYLAKARVLDRDGNPQAAMVEYRNAIGLDPTLAGVLLRIGEIYEAFDVVPEAIKAYAAEVQRHPKDRVAARKLGVALARAGEFDRAIQQLELLVRSDTRDGASWRALGFVYTHAHRFDDAERALRNAILVPPAEAEEYRDLGVLLANRGREREAREAYRRAAELDPHDGSTLVNLGNLEMRAGRASAALDWYRKAETADSATVLAYRGQVQALKALARESELGDLYRRWLRRLPDDETARLDAVDYFADRDRTDVALELGRDGVRHNPHSGYAHLVLGVAYSAAGDPRSALLELRRAEHFTRKDEPEVMRQVQDLIVQLRARAPDSLRTLFVQDSLAAARADTAAARPPGR